MLSLLDVYKDLQRNFLVASNEPEILTIERVQGRANIEERLRYEHGQATTLHQLGMMAEEHGDRAEVVRFYERGAA